MKQKPNSPVYEKIRYPLSTEKNIRALEAENKLVFVVDKGARKEDIKKAVEKLFNVKVSKVSTAIGPEGRKKAYISLAGEVQAIDIATDLGLM